MAPANKLLICFLLGFLANTYAQNYPKYTTQQVKGTTVTKPDPENGTAVIKEAKADKEPSADFGMLMQKGGKEYLKAEYDEAVKTYTEAFTVSPEELKYLVLQKRAWCHYALKNFYASIEDCTTALEKTIIPNENIRGSLYILRSLSYKLRNDPGDLERACADHQKAKEAGLRLGNEISGYDCGKK